MAKPVKTAHHTFYSPHGSQTSPKMSRISRKTDEFFDANEGKEFE